MHGGSLTVESSSEADSPDDHGSCFSVTLPLGKDHLLGAHVQDLSDIPRNRLYGQGLVDEASHWDIRPFDERTPSEASNSDGRGRGNSLSDGSKMDPSTLFFVKSDIILLGMCIPYWSTCKSHT